VTERQKRKQPQFKKILNFVRHGNYEPGESGGKLTALGRKQVVRLARRLNELSLWPIERIHTSPWGRAVETAQIIADQMGSLKVHKRPFLHEVHPTGSPNIAVPLKIRAIGKENLNITLNHYFRPPRSMQQEVIVSHGGLIRALVCRVLDVRLTAHVQMETYEASITSFLVPSEGKPQLITYNDTGHLPAQMITGGVRGTRTQ